MNKALPFLLLSTLFTFLANDALQAQTDSTSVKSKIVIKSQVQIGNDKKETIIERQLDGNEDISTLLDSIFNTKNFGFNSIEIFQRSLEEMPSMLDSFFQNMEGVNPMDLHHFFESAKNTSPQPFLGIVFEDMISEEEDSLVKKGILITRVIKSSAAEEAGLQAGDLLIVVNDQPVNDIHAIQSIIREKNVGDKLSITYERDGKISATVAQLKAKQESQDSWTNTFYFNDDLPPMSGLPPCDKIVIQKSGPRLGISITALTEEAREDLKVKKGGALITKVDKGSCASKMGLSVNDVITNVNNQKVESPEQLKSIINQIALEADIKVEYIRYGRKKKTSGQIMEYSRAWDK